MGPFYSIYKTQVTHLSLNVTLKHEQHTTPLHVQKPLPQHVHHWQTGKEKDLISGGDKKNSVIIN
jgi:hypothetical protein